MAYKAIDVAKYIVSYCNEMNHPISNLKLQKLLYYAWIDFYKETKVYLFEDLICAWQLGPVVPDVYYEFCSYAGIPIPRSYIVDISDNDKLLINATIDKYSSYTASELVDKTHKKGKPWDLMYKNGAGARSEIPFPMIINLECQNEN